MKQNVFVFIAALLLLACPACGTTKDAGSQSDTSQNSLDWAGIYAGTIPAASGEGIQVEITLNNDKTYKVTYRYIGKSDKIFANAGTFAWNNKGSVITLDNKDLPPHYQVGENVLIQLDIEGNKIEGQHADRYILKKRNPKDEIK